MHCDVLFGIALRQSVPVFQAENGQAEAAEAEGETAKAEAEGEAEGEAAEADGANGEAEDWEQHGTNCNRKC